ncbi:hypothetical protein H1R20_g1168, partial [Candolleomyces eurysporus]
MSPLRPQNHTDVVFLVQRPSIIRSVPALASVPLSDYLSRPEGAIIEATPPTSAIASIPLSIVYQPRDWNTGTLSIVCILLSIHPPQRQDPSPLSSSPVPLLVRLSHSRESGLYFAGPSPSSATSDPLLSTLTNAGNHLLVLNPKHPPLPPPPLPPPAGKTPCLLRVSEQDLTLLSLVHRRKMPETFAMKFIQENGQWLPDGNEHQGRRLEYRAKDMLSFMMLEEEVLPDEAVKLNGSPEYTLEELKKAKGHAQWLISSPNMYSIPQALIGVRHVRARANGKYGLDDRMLHPQVVCKGYEWIGCIPKPCNDLHILRWTPRLEDTTSVTGTWFETDCRIFKEEHVDALRGQATLCFDIAFKTLERQRSATILSSMVAHTQQCLERLTYGLPYRDLLLTVGDIQRACLDIRGLSTYITTFWPRSVPTSMESLKPHCVDTSLMGCFTHSREEAQFLHSIGIPVWWIRPAFSVNQFDTRVWTSARQSTTYIDPSVVKADYIEAESGRKVFTDVYVGLAGTDLQRSTLRLGCRVFDVTEASAIAYQRLEKKYRQSSTEAGSSIPSQPVYIYSLLDFLKPNPGPSAETIAAAHPLPTTPSPSSSNLPPASLSASSDQSSSSSSNPSADIPVSRHPPMPPKTDTRPPEIPVWRRALTNIQPLLKSGQRQAPHYAGYQLPEIGLFYNATAENELIYIATWLATRQVHLYNLANGVQLGTIKRQQWQHYLKAILKSLNPEGGPSGIANSLTLQDATPGQPSSLSTHSLPTSSSHTLPAIPSGQSKPSTKSKRKSKSGSNRPSKQTKNDDGSDIYLTSLPARQERLDKILWYEQTIMLGSKEDLKQALTPEISAEVLYELRETTFCVELMALDQVLAPHKWGGRETNNSDGDSLVQPGEQVAEIFLSMIPNVDRGLAAKFWADRHPFVKQLHLLMLDWEGCPKAIREVPISPGPINTPRLEKLVVDYYCQTFATSFGRAPVTPCRLPYRARIRKQPARSFGSLTVESRARMFVVATLFLICYTSSRSFAIS